MKLVRTFESITLDNEDKVILMQHALDRNKGSLIKSLFDDGYDPNSKIGGQYLLLYYANLINESTFDLNKFNLIIDSGGDINIDNGSIFFDAIYLYTKKRTNTVQYIKLLKRFIELGADLTSNLSEDEECALDLIFEKIEWNYPKKLSKEIINMIKQEAPKQYDEYIDRLEMKMNADKYNL